MFLAAAAAFGMTGFGALYGAPWYFHAPVLFALLLSGWAILINKQSGISVCKAEIELFAGSWRRTLRVADVRGYRSTQWSEGADWVHLLLDNGEELLIPTNCTGPLISLQAALESAGIHKQE